MHVWKNHGFTNSQRIGILALVILILGIMGFGYWWQQKTLDEVSFSEQENKMVLAIQDQIDSLKQQKIKTKPRIYPFNPNFISDYKGYTLGMSPKEIDRLQEFRKKGEWVNSKHDFQRVTKISDSLFTAISPYFKFPAWVVERNRRTYRQQAIKNKSLSFGEKEDLNAVTAALLQEIKGVGPVLASRIIRYRAKLHNFLDDSQLKDVYGLNFETRQHILAKFTVKNKAAENKLNLNTASVIELAENVYLNYELAREIVEYRLLHEKIETFEELSSIKDFPDDKIERMKLYLEID